MARARHKISALQIALVWLLALVMLPPPAEACAAEGGAEACESWCPCDQGEGELAAHANEDCADEDCADEDCEQDDCGDEGCSEDCSRCSSARSSLALGSDPIACPLVLVGSVSTGPPAEARGRRVAEGIFRPPRSLT